jgi:hypothetical protein
MRSVRLSLASEVGVQKAIGAAVRSRAENVIMQITLDRAILENLREHASSAAHLVGHIDDAPAVGPLAEHVDEIVHTLSELLGRPTHGAARSGGNVCREVFVHRSSSLTWVKLQAG